MYGLLPVVFVYWLLLFVSSSSNTNTERVRIPQAFFCSECNKVVVYKDSLKGHPPYRCKICHKRTCWPAFTCTECKNEDGSPLIFPNIIRLPEGVKPPAPGEEPSVEYMDAMMKVEGVIPECPICGNMETVKRYLTPEAEKMLQELREKYKKRRRRR